VVGREGTLTYGELGRRALVLAHRLQELGVGPDVLVGVVMERSLEMPVALLATLTAGGAYLPIDPTLPEQRIRLMLEEARPTVLLASEAAANSVSKLGAPIVVVRSDVCDGPSAVPAAGVNRTLVPENLAYVLYTSGSTGRPKGVAITHRSANAFLDWASGVFSSSELSGVLASTSIGFDLSVFEIFLPLTCGGCVILAENLLELPHLKEAGLVTLVNTVPSVMVELLREGALPDGVETVNLAGEPLPAKLVRRVYAQGGVRRVINLYGPTEDTTYSTYSVVRPGLEAPPSIGLPIDGSRALVLDGAMRPVAPGRAGELYLGGTGLARGYLRRPDLTAERFVPDPDAAEPGARLYRTGDRVRLLAGGELEYVGRTDQQVKVRGQRIELGEIEAALVRCPGVAAAAVMAHGVAEGRRLVAYFVGDGDPMQAHALRAALKQQLPGYMVPAAFIQLAGLPLTPNGKIDRQALPAPGPARRPASSSPAPPSTALEQQLSIIWSDLLELSEPGVDDDFLDLGGDSLLAIRVLSRIRSDLGLELPPLDFFAAGTIRELGRRLARAEAVDGMRAPVPRHPGEAAAPLSYAQRGFWFWWKLEPASGFQNLAVVLRVSGELDADLLAASLGLLVARHELLRTSFRVGPDGVEQVVSPERALALAEVDLQGLGRAERAAAVEREASAEASQGFDLAGDDALLRARLLRLGRREAVLLLTMPHIVSDGWSISVLLRDLLSGYRALGEGRQWQPGEPAVRFRDYAIWQQEAAADGRWDRDLEYWRERLRGAAQLELKPDGRRRNPPGWAGERRVLELGLDLSRRLKRLSRERGATLSMTLLAAFKVLLARHSGERDVMVGVPVAGRGRPELEDLVGPVLNLLAVRTDLSGEPTFAQLLDRVRESTLGAYAHQELPLARLVEALGRGGELTRSHLFQAVFNMYNFPSWELEEARLHVEPLTGPLTGALFELTLYAREERGRVRLELVYDTELFTGGRMEELLAQLEQLLGQVAGEPERSIEEYSLVTSSARGLLPDPRAPLAKGVQEGVHRLISLQAANAPDRVAVIDETGSLTYGQLEVAANRLAHRLLADGVGRESVVAIHARRASQLVWAILGVLKAGAAFTILDQAHPAPRLAAQLLQARPEGWIDLAGGPIAGGELAEALAGLGLRARLELAGGAHDAGAGPLAGLPGSEPLVDVTGDDLAYVVFTSGTSGAPRGVLGTHGPLVHFLEWQAGAFGLDAGDRFSMLSGLSHDPLLRDIFAPLAAGGVLCIPDEQAPLNPSLLRRWLLRRSVTVAHLTPIHGRMICELAAPAELVQLRLVFFGGDTLTSADVRDFRRIAPAARIVNFYGTTETPQAMGWHEVVGTGPTVSDRGIDIDPPLIPIGMGIPDVQLLVLNSRRRLAGLGELGELYVRTPHLTRGYLGDEVETQARYLANPLAPSDPDAVYATGDLGRYGQRGEVRLAGRIDTQLKVRGFRVEPAEVESCLMRHGGVREAAVVGWRQPAGDVQLVAYVVAASSLPPSTTELRRHLATRVPEHMVPVAFVRLDHLPTTPNGKLDQRALPRPQPVRPDLEQGYRAPEGQSEELIAAIWRPILGLTTVGTHDNFFDLGGNSVSLARVHAELELRLQRVLNIVDLFRYPDVHSLARFLDGGLPKTALPTTFAADRPRTGSEARNRRHQSRLASLGKRAEGDPSG
jgi:amino acid adenylation domain-containing protein